ncbi:hypothetical protein SAMN06298216_3900 [Spirosomataceae bacterium TFI 002]|nr:hypothetical protein SAMN06298216_3900 [Spirosomataceae bacterium TFI 002]
MNRTLATLLTYFISASAFACPVCEKQQPAITQGLTHGAGPQSNWDWAIIAVISVITLLTFFYSLKYLLRPGESNSNHIKQSILSD